MDRRQKKTREAIFSAFSTLLKQKRYEHITVQDIIDKADICRSTFYMHFETKDMLLKEKCSDIFDHIFKGDICDYEGDSISIEAKLAHILWHLKNSRNDVIGLLSTESGDLFMAYLKEYLTKLFTLHLSDFKKAVPDDFLLNHLVGSFSETVKWWVADKMNTSHEATAQYFMKCTAG